MKISTLLTSSFFLLTSLFAHAQTAYVDGKTVIPGVDYAGQEGSRIPQRTNFTFSDDGAALVIAFDIDYPMDNLDEKKGIWSSGDNVEIWLDPSGEGKKVMQFAIDPFGRRWDRRAPKSDASEFKWTSDVTRGAKGWKATVRFPYADFGMEPPKKGDRWMCNVCRSLFADKSGTRTFATWAAVGANFNNPGKFNELLFGSAEEVAEVRRQRRITETAALRKELTAKGYADRFAFKLQRLEAGATDVLIREIRDEMKLLDAMKTNVTKWFGGENPARRTRRFMSYNVCECFGNYQVGFGAGDRSPERYTNRLEEVTRIIRAASPEWCALQEVCHDMTNGVDHLSKFAARTGMHVEFADSASTWQGLHFGGGWGVALLSKVPPLKVRRFVAGHSEKHPRSVLAAEFEEYVVYAAHFTFTDPYRVETIADVEAELAKETKPVFLVGDLNLQPTEKEVFERLQRKFTILTDGTGNTWPAVDPTQRLDYILVDTAHAKDWHKLRAWSLPEKEASDHRPIFLELAPSRCRNDLPE